MAEVRGRLLCSLPCQYVPPVIANGAVQRPSASSAACWLVAVCRVQRLGDQFEARWRRAYEVRHLENQNRHKMAATGEGGAKVSSHLRAAVCWVGGQQRLGLPRLFAYVAAPTLQADPTTIAATAAKPGSVQPAAVALNASAGPPSPAALGQAHSLPSTGSPAAKPLIRQREVEDDDADFEETAAVLPRGPAELGAATGTSEAGQAEQEVPEPECRVAWDSSHSSQQPAAASAPTSAGTGSGAQQLKEQGTECLRQGDLLGALRCYSEGLQAALAAGEKPEVLAVLHSNRSHVLHKLRRNNEVRCCTTNLVRLYFLAMQLCYAELHSLKAACKLQC